MALTDYLQRVRFLLGDETFARHNDFTNRRFINEARGQIAGEGECLVNYATLVIDAPVQQYRFSGIELSASTTGVAGVLNVRKASWTMAAGDGGQVRMTPREWEWFQNYVLATTPPAAGQPQYWAQFGQGASGSIWVNLPDSPYTLYLDTVCYPLPLLLDSDHEALPYPWTDAIPYYTCYLAHAHLQDAERAQAMMQLYQLYMQRARGAATPSVLPHQYRQSPDPVMANRLGLQAAPARQ